MLSHNMIDQAIQRYDDMISAARDYEEDLYHDRVITVGDLTHKVLGAPKRSHPVRHYQKAVTLMDEVHSKGAVKKVKKQEKQDKQDKVRTVKKAVKTLDVLMSRLANKMTTKQKDVGKEVEAKPRKGIHRNTNRDSNQLSM